MSRSLRLHATGDLLRRTAAVFRQAWRTRQQLAAPHPLAHELMRWQDTRLRGEGNAWSVPCFPRDEGKTWSVHVFLTVRNSRALTPFTA